jgi:hypothetical protein
MMKEMAVEGINVLIAASVCPKSTCSKIDHTMNAKAVHCAQPGAQLLLENNPKAIASDRAPNTPGRMMK